MGHPRTGLRARAADTAAIVGFIVSAAALLAMSVVFVWTPYALHAFGPCPDGPISCVAAHPEFYRVEPGGSYSSELSRFYDSLTPVPFVACALAVGGALLSWSATRMKTRFGCLAVSGALAGYFTLFWFLGLVLFFFLNGGG